MAVSWVGSIWVVGFLVGSPLIKKRVELSSLHLTGVYLVYREGISRVSNVIESVLDDTGRLGWSGMVIVSGSRVGHSRLALWRSSALVSLDGNVF